MKEVRMLIVVCLGSLVLAGAASAQTVSIPGMPCSATASQSFATVNGTFTQNYGGGTSCAGGVGQKTLDVVPQVFNVVNGKPIWFNVSLVGAYQGPTPINPLRLSGSRAAVASHQYRVLVYGQITLNGKTSSATACAGTCSGSPATDDQAVEHQYTVRSNHRGDLGSVFGDRVRTNVRVGQWQLHHDLQRGRELQ